MKTPVQQLAALRAENARLATAVGLPPSPEEKRQKQAEEQRSLAHLATHDPMLALRKLLR